MPTLKEILDSNSEVILDSSAERSTSFLWEIFESRDYSHLNANDIRDEILNYQRFLDALEHPNARTTHEITQEIRTHAEKLGEKTSYLKDPKEIYRHGAGNLNKKHRKWNKKKKGEGLTDSLQIDPSNQKLLETLQENVFHAYQISRSKELEITDPDYKTFAEAIIQLERLLHLKQDTAYFLGKSDEDRAHYSDTDEKITATILWQSMFSNQSPALVTLDQDFIRLFGALPRLLGSDTFLPYNQLFRKRVTENPFRLYYTNDRTKDDYEHSLNNSHIDFLPEFQSNVFSRRTNQETEDRIGEFWKQFSQSKTTPSITTLTSQKSL